MNRRRILRYLVYFGVFITFVQILGHRQVQAWFTDFGWKLNIELIGTYAPLFLSILLFDATNEIGKRQNKIADRQSRIERHRLYKDLYSLVVRVERESNKLISDLFNMFFYINETECTSRIRQKQSDLSDCLSRIKESEVDFHILRFNQSDNVYVKIEELLEIAEYMINIVTIINNSYSKEIINLKYPLREDVIKGDNIDIENMTRNLIEMMIEINEISSINLVDTFDQFLAKRKELFGSENNILNLIKEEANADYQACC